MLETRMKHARSFSRLCLGAAQIGMSYGIGNMQGVLSEAQAHALLSAASAGGVNFVDTARIYGESEVRIGHWRRAHPGDLITVITKLPSGLASIEAVAAAIKESCAALGLERLPYLLLHDWQDTRWLSGIKTLGLVERLGVSVYTPDEAKAALALPEIECIQLPYNLFDWRWDTAIEALFAARQDVLVLARSVYLQGVIGLPFERWPNLSEEESKRVAEILDSLVIACRRESQADLCLAYVRAQTWIDSVIVGMETLKQLEENLRLFAKPALSPAEVVRVRAEMPRLAIVFLDPRAWPKV